MTKERTEKSKYQHHTTGEYCTCAAYIAERMCLNLAQFQNKGSLPYKFWNTKNWNWRFKKQVILANKLINEYGEKPVIKAILSDELFGVFSLKNKNVLRVIKKYSNIKNIELVIPPPEIVENPTCRNKSFGKKSMLSRLQRLELYDQEKNKT